MLVNVSSIGEGSLHVPSEDITDFPSFECVLRFYKCDSDSLNCSLQCHHGFIHYVEGFLPEEESPAESSFSHPPQAHPFTDSVLCMSPSPSDRESPFLFPSFQRESLCLQREYSRSICLLSHSPSL